MRSKKINYCLLLIFAVLTSTASAAHPEAIVTPAWVNSVQQFHAKKITARPVNYKNKRFVILETGWGKLSEAKDYRIGHIPSAVYLSSTSSNTNLPPQ